MATVTLRPIADGALLQNAIYPTTPTTHYDKVDEETPNDWVDYVYCPITLASARDSYVKPSTGIPAGSTINSVTIYNRAYTPPTESGLMPYAKRLLRNAAGTVWTSTTNNQAKVWTTLYDTLTTSPFTRAAWTLDEVEGLQIGCENTTVEDPATGTISSGSVSTVWLVVDYTPPAVGVPRFIGNGLAGAVIIV
jgi:hypothetical protein